MAFELILVDAETQDFSVQRLTGNSQLGSLPVDVAPESSRARRVGPHR
jgi:hypothetical protein